MRAAGMVLVLLGALVLPACQEPGGEISSDERRSAKSVDLLSDGWQGHAIAYSGFRDGQSPDSDALPSQAQVLLRMR